MYCVVLCSILLYYVALSCIVFCCIILCCIVLYCTMLHCLILSCLVLYCSTLSCIVLYCTVVYRSSVVFFTWMLLSVVMKYYIPENFLSNQVRNFTLAFKAAESADLPSTLVCHVCKTSVKSCVMSA